MATLERIRQRSGILIIVIGLAMLAFILTDLLGSGGILFNDQSTIGKVDGKKISREEFAYKVEELKASNPQYAQLSNKQLADFVWNNMLREEIMGKEYAKLGMAVTTEELDFEIKQNQQIQQAFVNPNTGQFDEGQFYQYVSSIRENREKDQESADVWNQWIGFEKGMKDQSLMNKYNTAVQKGMYTPKALAQAEYVAGNKSYEMQFVQLSYAAIADSTITVTDADKKKFYRANKEKYKQEAARNLEYVFFPNQPSATDREAVRADLNNLLTGRTILNTETGLNDTLPGFRFTDNDSTFAAGYSDDPVDMGYKKKGELSPSIDSTFFDSPVGTVFGPYEESGAYMISKVSDIKMIPDSVKARHILIAYQGAERAGQEVTRSGQEAKALADSLFKVLQDNRSLFDSISKTYNNDITAATKGGDLGWFTEGSMAEPFSNYCFYNKTGDLGLVFTNFGFHIINITDQKGATKAVRVTTIARNVMPTEETLKEIYSKASTYASEAQQSEDFRALAEKNQLVLRPATNIKQLDDNIPGLGQSRKIVQWAWDKERKEGNIGLIENEGQGYVVVILTDILEEGYTPMEKMDEQLTAAVIKEKKGEILTKQLAEAKAKSSDINAIATSLGGKVSTQSLNRKSMALVGSGAEPKVIGMMVGGKTGQLSEPMAGENAAYIWVLSSVGEAFDKGEYTEEITNSNTTMRDRVQGEVFEAIKKGKKVEDKRYIFY